VCVCVCVRTLSRAAGCAGGLEAAAQSEGCGDCAEGPPAASAKFGWLSTNNLPAPLVDPFAHDEPITAPVLSVKSDVQIAHRKRLGGHA
jgi:hypothetical protein